MSSRTNHPTSAGFSDAKSDLKLIPMPELREKLKSSPDGLSQDEAKKRLIQYGLNEFEEKKANP